jgi:hypothetical protein
MKRIVIIAIALLLLILDNTIIPSYSIMQGYPSILFVFAIAFSIINCSIREGGLTIPHFLLFYPKIILFIFSIDFGNFVC